MSDDEANWASWKCDGGPSIDWEAYNNPNNISFVRPVVTVQEVPQQLEQQPQTEPEQE